MRPLDINVSARCKYTCSVYDKKPVKTSDFPPYISQASFLSRTFYIFRSVAQAFQPGLAFRLIYIIKSLLILYIYKLSNHNVLYGINESATIVMQPACDHAGRAKDCEMFMV